MPRFATQSWATITGPRRRAYRLTDEDVFWAAKMAAFEGDPAEVLWTMTQRFAQATHPWNSFTEFIQAFSQPINPKWQRTGVFCQPGGKGYRTRACEENRLARRDRVAAMDWSELEALKPTAVAYTLTWAKGRLPNPVPGAINFAAPSVAQRYLDRNPGAKLLAKRGNWFLSEGGSENWAADAVSMFPPTGAAPAPAGGDVGAPGFFAVFWDRMSRPYRVRRG